MSKEEIIKYLEFCNTWRKGEEVAETPDPQKFTKAIEFAIDYMRKH